MERLRQAVKKVFRTSVDRIRYWVPRMGILYPVSGIQYLDFRLTMKFFKQWISGFWILNPGFVLLPSTFFLLFCLASADSIRLTWDPGTSPRLEGYNIYRRVNCEREYDFNNPLNEKILDTTWYQDDDVDPGKKYCYVVTAVSVEGLESEPSAELEVSPFELEARASKPTGTYLPGDLVILVADTAVSEGVTFVWRQISGRMVVPSGWTSRELSFLAPQVNAAQELLFEVEAKLGSRKRADAVTIFVFPQ